MLLLYSILGGILLLLLLLLFLPTFVGVDYLLEHGISVLRIRIRVLGIPFSFRVPLDRKKKQKPEKEREKKKEPMTPQRLIDFSKSLYRAYHDVKEDCKTLLSHIKKRFACHELYFAIHYGTGNPAGTGMLNGAIWTAGTMILSVLDNALGVYKKTLNVYPDFNRSFLSLQLKGTLRFMLFDAVRTVLKIIKLVNLIKSKLNSLETEERN